MSKIGIKINNIHLGVNEAYKANDGISPWITQTRDTRDDLRNVGINDPARGFVPVLLYDKPITAPLYMLSYDTEGCYLCSLTKSSGRTGDHVAVWYYLPREADISSLRLRQLLELVDTEVMTGGVINEARLNAEFQREFPNKPVVPVYNSSNPQGGYAVRYYGRGTDYSLDDLLGSDIFQPSYVQYRAVFLIDKASGLFCQGAADLTSIPLSHTVTLMPPRPDAMGFMPFLGNQPFTAPQLAYRGSTLQLVWRKEGFKDIVKILTVKNDPTTIPDVQPNDIRWIVPYNHFNVVDETNRNVPNCLITVAGKPLSAVQQVDVPYDDLKRGVRVKVSKQGYDDVVVDYHGGPMPVRLEKSKLSYQFIFPEGDMVSVTGNRMFERSPFAGYTANGDGRVVVGQNRLHKTGGGSIKGFGIKELIIGAAAGALLVGLAWFLTSWLGSKSSNAEEEPVTTEVSVSKSDSIPEQETMNFNVLNNPVWNKDALEKAGFNGLWDALNNYSLEEVLSFDSKHHNELRKVPNWVNLFRSIRELKRSGNTISGTFNNLPNDMNVNIEEYIKKLLETAQNITLDDMKMDAEAGPGGGVGAGPGANINAHNANQRQQAGAEGQHDNRLSTGSGDHTQGQNGGKTQPGNGQP